MTTCTKCRREVAGDARYCIVCGTPTPPDAARDSAGTNAPVENHADETADEILVEFEAQLRTALGDQYRLVEAIGQGGFARVYKATDVRLDRVVAIKVIRPDLAGARAFLDRFRREGVALAKLRHPGVIPIYDIRERDGLIYYVMPFVDGEDLRSRLARLGRLPPLEAHRILSELADAIGAAHRAGIVHRDIKPENVILEGTLQKKALLMDFGIAKALSQDDKELTEAGMLVGTPTYMSPEQATGDADIDHRSDIYSLGVMAYHMVTGELPFGGRSVHEIIAQHLTHKPPPVRTLNPSVPKAFSDAIDKCLAKDPFDRFATTSELWGALKTVTFFPDREPVERTAERLFNLKLGTAAVVALLLGLFGGRVAFGPRPQPVVAPVITADAFLTNWFQAVERLADNPLSPPLRRPVESAFGDSALVEHAGATHTDGVERHAAPRFVREREYVRVLASLSAGPRRLVDYGIVTMATVAYNEPTAGCGLVRMALAPREASWQILHVAVQRQPDASCPSPEAD